MKPPNILWISTHDIGPHLGCYEGVWPGAEIADTPHLDALAREGVRFDQAFAAAPVCAPSRSAIMTGCYPTAIGTMHMRTKAVPPPQVRLLSDYLREGGYYTTNNWFTDFQVDTPEIAFDECSPTAHWRNRPSDDTPFFAAFHGMTTHESRLYVDEEAFRAATPHVSDDRRHRPEDVQVPPYHPDTDAFRITWARYLDLITEMDHWVGELLAELDESGVADDTIVVFWSDHGPGMPRGKRWATEAGLREPLIVRWPGRLSAGEAHADVVELLDLTPTMLEAAGLPIPEHMHGSLLFDRTGEIAPPKEYAFGGRDRMDEQQDRVRTVRDTRFRYVRNMHPDRPPLQHNDYADHTATWGDLRRLAADEARQLARGERPNVLTPLQRSLIAASKPTEELYDIRADPHEEHNLAEDPAFAAELSRLRGALESWSVRTGDLGAMPEDELLDLWSPGGTRPTTAAPRATAAEDGIRLHSATPGARVGWTTDPPGAAESPNPLELLSGSPRRDGRRWTLYTGPFRPPAGDVWAKAWRLGFEPSADVRFDSAPTTHPSTEKTP